MNEELRKKVIADIHKTGFGAEMQAMRTFREAGWISRGSRTYFDRDRKQSREIDIQATLLRPSSTPAVLAVFELVVEVKKTKSPWVVFRDTSGSSGGPLSEALHALTRSAGLPDGVPSLEDLLDVLGGSIDGWVGSGVHESFRDPKQRSRWYAACVTACKAAEDTLSHHAGPVGELPVFVHVQPLVVIDGLLLRAGLDGSETIVEEVSWATIPFEFATPAYQRGHYNVDFVRLDALAGYLELARRRADALFGKVIQRLTQPRAT